MDIRDHIENKLFATAIRGDPAAMEEGGGGEEEVIPGEDGGAIAPPKAIGLGLTLVHFSAH